MSKYLVIAAALIVLAVACNNKEETAAPADQTVEQTSPEASDMPVEGEPVEGDMPAEDMPAAE